ncbi:hypothetical protein PHMEG_00033042 [Phytophthora megakarya]|uniref:Ubiquitin-like protease family profile domain-containing protein n=1 Tax=Phytophthora megakarya TaxID=4795 RepID=A0A225UU19_9STRA|nr:hypothetical protein PHMEG_00033042 [Phytophthora megakarya]
MFKSYKQQYHLKFRYKIFRCTHGVSQSSRSKGHRNRKSRYTKCMARFTAVVCMNDDNEYHIAILNQGFYAVQAKGHMWLEDRKWLEQDWKRIESNVNLFADETGCNELPTEAIPKRHQALANEVISKFASCRLRTQFLTLSGKGMICFDNIIGHICRNWLNDSVIDFCMETIGTFIGNCYVLSSLMWSVVWPKLPRTSIRDTKFIVNPVNLDSNHWGVIIVRLSYKGGSNNVLRAQACMYEPLVDEGDEHSVGRSPKDLNDKNSNEQEGFRSWLQRWHKESMLECNFVISKAEWVKWPHQPDATSCGVLIVAHTYNYLTENTEGQKCKVSKSDVTVMRLRMLWTIMHRSKELSISKHDAATTANINQKLQDQLK